MATELTRLVPENPRGTCIESQTECNNNNNNNNNGEVECKFDSPSKDMIYYSEIMKSFAFGGYDGILTSLAIISGAAGGEFSWKATLILGISIIIANALSIGISEYLSSKAHKEFLLAEKRKELWEFKHYKDGEVLEMIKRFESRGMARRDAELVVSKMAQYENIFVGLMVAEELGLQPTFEDDKTLLTDAFIMFFSFAFFGLIPIVLFGIGALEIFSDQGLFYFSASISLFVLMILGIVKSSFTSGQLIYSAFEAIGLGLICSSVAFTMSAGVMGLLSR